jgi:hypothetical protein
MSDISHSSSQSTRSSGPQPGQAPSQPSSPPTDENTISKLADGQNMNGNKSMDIDGEDDIEDVDGKAKALTNLLKTSSVCSPAMVYI